MGVSCSNNFPDYLPKFIDLSSPSWVAMVTQFVKHLLCVTTVRISISVVCFFNGCLSFSVHFLLISLPHGFIYITL